MSEISDLIGHYDSYEIKNLAKRFYIPMFRAAKRVDRVSCYFSAKALAIYGEGLEEFAKKLDSRYRLIISEDISQEDFDAIKAGDLSFESHDEMFVNRLRENITVDEQDALGTLVNLMDAGVVQIKIAFVRKGLFHSKWAYVEGENSERMVLIGSNNETPSAIEINYEEFDFRTYLATDNFMEKFEQMWENKRPGFIVEKPSNLIWAELKNYAKNKNRLLNDLKDATNCLILDLRDEQIVLENRLDNPPSNHTLVFRSRIKPYVKSFEDAVFFRHGLTYIDYRKIVDNLSKFCTSNQILLYVSKTLNDYINEHDLLMEKRISLGLDIKNRNNRILAQFEEYKSIVDGVMIRRLYDKQMWDSFFMYAMKKAGNFSVPGSGKTASVLGVFAFLKQRENIRSIIIICPLNSFDSWITEYEECFGITPDVFDARYYSGPNTISSFYNRYSTSDIILINYDSLNKYSEVLAKNAVPHSLLVFDEGHYVKNTDAQRTKGAMTVSNDATRTIILTGTPMPNSYADLYSLLNIMFPDEYHAYFRYDIGTLRNPSDAVISDINRKIQPFYVRTSKDDLGIPAANKDLEIHAQAGSDEVCLYNKICESCMSNPLTLIIRILQAESDPKMLLSNEVSDDIISNFKEEPSGELTTIDSEMSKSVLIPELKGIESLIQKISITSKTRKCIELVSNLVTDGMSVIIWCIFRKSIINLHEMLNKIGITCEVVDGTVPIKDRTEVIDRFKQGNFKVLITNPHTLAESISLHQICHDTVYFEYSYNLVHLLQSKDRIHRLGLPKEQYTQHRFLMTDFSVDGLSHSLDAEIFARLKYKENLMKDAIESGKLESATSSTEEDVEEIFSKMGWTFKSK